MRPESARHPPTLAWTERVLRAALVVALAIGAGGLLWDAVDDGRSWLGVNNSVVLYEGVEMLEGARLYVDWRDTNPPAIYLLTLSTSWLADLLSLPVTLTYYMLVLAIAGAGFALLRTALQGADPAPRAAALLAYVLFIFHPTHGVLDFGEREHLFTLLFVPFLFAAGSAVTISARFLPLLGLLGFLATMKPHLLLGLVATAAIAVILGWRPRRLDLGALTLGASLPLPALYLHSPDSFDAFFEWLIPLHLSGSYGYLERGWSGLFAPGPGSALAAAGLVGAGGLWAVRTGRVSSPLAATYVVGLAAMVAGALHQKKFWDYQFIPVFGLSLVGGAYLIALPFARTGSGADRGRPGWLPAAVMGLAAIAGAVRFVEATTFTGRTPLVERLVSLGGHQGTLMAISTHVAGIFDPEHDSVRALGPWPGHFELPAAAHLHDPVQRNRALAAQAAEIRARIEEARPALILLSIDDALFQPGVSPFTILGQRYPVVPAEAYSRVRGTELEELDLNGWVVFRRRPPGGVAHSGR